MYAFWMVRWIWALVLFVGNVVRLFWKFFVGAVFIEMRITARWAIDGGAYNKICHSEYRLSNMQRSRELRAIKERIKGGA